MSADRPLHRPIFLAELADDVAALRAGSASPRALVHVAHAAEHALRRLLRDDPTAPVELRLQALAPEELPLDALLAELRRRDRIPMELAAGMHDLAAAAARAEAEETPGPRDAANAVTVADALEAHLGRRPSATTLEDPLLPPDPEPAADDGEPHVHAVPPAGPARHGRWLAAALAVAGLVALVVWLVGRENPERSLRRADELLARGRPASALVVLRGAAPRSPGHPGTAVRLARIYREAGRPTEALRALRAGLSAAPHDPRLHEELGAVLLEQKRSADAVRAYREALLADSASERAWVGLARALREGGDPAAAARVLAAAPERARILGAAGPPPPAPSPPPAP